MINEIMTEELKAGIDATPYFLALAMQIAEQELHKSSSQIYCATRLKQYFGILKGKEEIDWHNLARYYLTKALYKEVI